MVSDPNPNDPNLKDSNLKDTKLSNLHGFDSNIDPKKLRFCTNSEILVKYLGPPLDTQKEKEIQKKINFYSVNIFYLSLINCFCKLFKALELALIQYLKNFELSKSLKSEISSLI